MYIYIYTLYIKYGKSQFLRGIDHRTKWASLGLAWRITCWLMDSKRSGLLQTCTEFGNICQLLLKILNLQGILQTEDATCKSQLWGWALSYGWINIKQSQNAQNGPLHFAKMVDVGCSPRWLMKITPAGEMSPQAMLYCSKMLNSTSNQRFTVLPETKTYSNILQGYSLPIAYWLSFKDGVCQIPNNGMLTVAQLASICFCGVSQATTIWQWVCPNLGSLLQVFMFYSGKRLHN